ncbi:MAG TPA: alpha/beta hydrolase, partial [Longimicrobium sp.]|nr:alpha/beta hydrolase [Longimicrobium sp.]
SHGNGEDLGDLAELLPALHDAGFSVLAWDYRGYGRSTGKPGERATYRDAEAAYAYLTRELGVAPERVIVHGRSLGGGPAAYLAATNPVGGLVLESTFTSIFAVVPGVRLFPFDRFRTGARLGRVRTPVLVIHGTEDEVVPFAHGRALLDRAPGRKAHLWVEGAGHNDLMLVTGDEYFAALRRFAESLSTREG